jgi:hypothetical protein
MTTTGQDITDYWSGDSLVIRIRVVDENGDPLDVSTAEIAYAIAKKAGSTTLVAKSSADADEITVVDGAGTGDEIQVQLVPGDTDALKGADYYHECQITDGDGNVYTVMAGTFTIETDQVQ